MNKILSLFLSFLFLSNSIFAAEIAKPSFEEFCPAIYYHKEPLPENWIETQQYSRSENALMWSSIIIFYPAIICYPLAISDTEWRRKQRSKKIRTAYNSSLKYWQDREKSFNNSLALCDSTKDAASCYVQVKLSEEQKSLAIERNRILKNIENGLYGIQVQQANTNLNLQTLN
jgi:hypothetical protein